MTSRINGKLGPTCHIIKEINNCKPEQIRFNINRMNAAIINTKSYVVLNQLFIKCFSSKVSFLVKFIFVIIKAFFDFFFFLPEINCNNQV